MKKLIPVILVLGTMLLFAFKSDVKHSNYKRGVWGEWRTTSCYRGLDFRVRRTQEDDNFNGKYEWEVQFRNRYEDQITFNFKITYPGDDSPTGDRESVSASSTSSGEDWALTTDAEQCEILVDKVRFGDDDGFKPYIECGN